MTPANLCCRSLASPTAPVGCALPDPRELPCAFMLSSVPCGSPAQSSGLCPAPASRTPVRCCRGQGGSGQEGAVHRVLWSEADRAARARLGARRTGDGGTWEGASGGSSQPSPLPGPLGGCPGPAGQLCVQGTRGAPRAAQHSGPEGQPGGATHWGRRGHCDDPELWEYAGCVQGCVPDPSGDQCHQAPSRPLATGSWEGPALAP